MVVPAQVLAAIPVPLRSLADAATNTFHAVLAPFEWVISQVLVTAHAALTAAGLPATSGLAWAASIAVLVAVVRLALLPLTIRQVRSAQRLAAAAPALRELRDRYRGVRDPETLARMRGESAAIYAQAGAKPLGCLPVLAQAPVLLALFAVLNAAAHGRPIAAMTPTLVAQVDAATLWGASLADTVYAGGPAAALAAALTAVMAATLWLGQHRQVRRNTPAYALEGPVGQAQRLSTYVLPVVTVISGFTFPIGVLLYWACTNTWSLGQQLAVIRWLPTPGSPAHAALATRTASADGVEDPGKPGQGPHLPRSGQRRQPRRRRRRPGRT